MPLRLLMWLAAISSYSCCVLAHAAELPSSLQFSSKSGRPTKFRALAVSPDGARIALCAGNQIYLIDPSSRRVLKQTSGDPFIVGYDSGGTRLYAIGSGRTYLFDRNLNPLPTSAPERTPGYVGIYLELANRRVVISSVMAGGPVEKIAKIQAGDQLISIGEGRSGMLDRVSSVQQALQRLQGPLGTWVRLEIIHQGATTAKVHQVQRWSENRHGQSLSFSGPPLITISSLLLNCTRDNRHDFDVIPTGKTLTSITPIDIGMPGPTALSRDSKRFAVLSRMRDGNGKAVEIYDVASGERLAFVAYQGSGLTEIAFSPDGKEVYAASVDSIEVMSVASAQTVARLHIDQRVKPQVVQHHISTGPSRYRNAAQLAVAPTGEVATGSTTGVIRFWDVKAGKRLLKIANSSESPTLDIKFSDDGSLVVWFTDDTLYWMPTANIHEFHKQEQATGVTGFARPSTRNSPLRTQDGSTDLESQLPSGVKLVQTLMTHPAQEARGGVNYETFLKFSPDSETLYLGGSVGVIPKFPQPLKEERRSRRARTPGNIVGATADAMADGAQRDRDLARKPESPLLEKLLIEKTRYPIGGKFRSIKGLHGQMPGSVDAYRVADGRWLRTFECRKDDDDIDLDACVDADLSPDGKLLSVLGGTGGDDGELHLFDAKSGKLLYEHEQWIDGTWYNLQEIAFLGDSRRFLTRDDDNYLLLHAAKSGRIIDKISIDDWPYHEGLHVSSDGKRFVLGKTSFDAHTASVIQPGDRNTWLALAVSSDGKRVVGADRYYRSQQKVLDGGQFRDFGPKRKERMRDAALSPDGKFLCLAIGTVAEIWAVDEELLLASLDQHLRTIDRVALAPNGKLLATCSEDGATRLWDLSELLSQRIPKAIEPIESDRFQTEMPVLLTGTTERTGFVHAKADDGRWFVRVGPSYCLLIEASQIQIDLATIAAKKAKLKRELDRSKRSYGPEQILGPPNTMKAGDKTTAWASKEANEPNEWLVVEFEKAILADEVVIHETYNPGAIQSVTLYSEDGSVSEVWKGTPKVLTEERRDLIVSTKKLFLTKFVLIDLACGKVRGWNEIDAVGLKDASSKQMVWAKRVIASSTFASGKMNPKFLATVPKNLAVKRAGP